MDATSFEFQLSVPREPHAAAIVQKLAVQAARYAGCGEPGAEAFGRQVEQAVLSHLNGAHTPGAIPVVVRRYTPGPLEVLVDRKTVALEI